MAKWTTADIPDQTGRVAVITGSNTGLGYETAAALAAKGAHVVMAVRNLDKGKDAATLIHRSSPNADVALQELDLTSLDSIRAAAEQLRATHDHIDLLINNAGVMYTPKSQTKDGFEMQFGTNHLGHFAFTGLLLDRLLPVAGSRVVTISSMGHRIRADIHFDDLQWEQSYNRVSAYGQAKLANLLFTYELQRRLAPNGTTIAVAAHPGGSNTELMRHLPGLGCFRLPGDRTDHAGRGYGRPAATAGRDRPGGARWAVLRTRRPRPDPGLSQDRRLQQEVARCRAAAPAVGGVRGADRCDVSRRLTQVEQLLVETTDAAGRVVQMDLQNPVADRRPSGVRTPHRLGRARRDVPLDPVADDLLVRKFAEQVAGDRAAERQPLGRGQGDDVLVQLGAGDVGMAVEIVAPAQPDSR